jgi:GTP-binding protein
MPLPIVTIVGRPNVGKSTLLNRLSGKRISIVDDAEGVTRDRVITDVEVDGRRFQLVDTGGIGFVDEERLREHVERQIEISLQRAQVILFVSDVRTGLTDADREIAQRLRRFEIPVIPVVNKVEGRALTHEVGAFFRLGLGEPVPISAQNGEGIDALFARILAELPPAQADEGEAPVALKLAIVGRRNAGKSTLVNSIAREERVIVSEIEGTTRDAVDVLVDRGSERWILIDTAGVRRKKALTHSVEFYSQARSEAAIRRADVVALLFDATTEISQVDKHLGRYAVDHYKPVVVVANKADLVPALDVASFEEYLGDRLSGLGFAPIAMISAQSGAGVPSLLKTCRDLRHQAQTRVSTAELNRVLELAKSSRLPSSSGKVPKMFYATQVSVDPPTIVIFVNDPDLFGKDYDRFLQNRFREHLPFREVPLQIVFRRREKVELGAES